MVIYEDYGTNGIGAELAIAYSDQGMMIEREGVLYESAVDPKVEHRVYTETDIPVDRDEETEAEYAEAGRILLGVEK